MNILGFNSVIIDSSSTLLQDGKITAALEEERFSRIKHDGAFPKKSIKKCLQIGNIKAKDIDIVVCSFQEWKAALSRSLTFLKMGNISGISNAMAHRHKEFFKIMGISQNLKMTLDSKKKIKLLKFNHHLCHAASTFFVSPFEKAAILVMDSTGEDTSISFHLGKDNRIKTIRQLDYAQSLGALYTSITEYLGFLPNNGESKVMGLASYGEPEYLKEFSKIVSLSKNGGISLDLSYFTHHLGKGVHASSKFIKKFGPARKSESDITPHHKNIASSLQKILEQASLHIVRHLKESTGEKNLCLAGGVTLNSVMNGMLLEKSGFRDIYLIPSPSDAGTSLGASLYYYHSILDRPRSFILKDPFLGVSYSDSQIDIAIRENPTLKSEIRKDYIQTAARLISEGSIIGWFQGKFEFGPRALGHRSILADPRKKEMKDILNSRVKFRESFRPFAPAVLYEKRADFFTNLHQNPFMLFVFKIKEEMRSVIPAVTHVDGTGRGQTVSKENSPLFWKLIKNFENITGVPVVLNTSFNVRGKPIINTPREAIECYLTTGIDYLFLGNRVIWKNGKTRP